jgi:hypothetical protein
MNRLLIGALVGASISCGSSGGGVGDSSGVPRSSTIGSLTVTQAATLCDWEDAKQGGYNRTVTCTDGNTRTTDASQAECVSGMGYARTFCPSLTVADVEDCANAIGVSICEISTAPACANLAACLGY